MNKSQLAKVLAKKGDLSLKEAEKIITAFAETIGEALSKGQKITYSNFGNFYTVHYPSKVIYHPILGAKKSMVMEPTDAVKWMPSDNVKALVDKGINIENAVKFGKAQFVTGTRKKKKPTSTPKTETLPQETREIQADDEEYEIPIKKIVPKSNEVVEQLETIDSNQPVAAQDSSKNEDLPTDKSKPGFWDQLFNRVLKEEGHEKKAQIHDAIKKNYLGSQTKKTVPQTEINNSGESKLGGGVFSKENQSSVSDLINQETPLKSPTKPQNLSEANTSSLPITNEGKPKKERLITPLFSHKTAIKFVDLSSIAIPKELLSKIPEKIARKYEMVPIEEKDDEVIVATVDPENLEALEMMKRLLMKNVSPRLTTQEDLNHVYEQYQRFESEVKDAIDDVAEDEIIEPETKEKVSKEQITDTAPASRIVSSLLKKAIREKASDIHIEPTDDEVVVRFRLDGVLHKKVSLPSDIQFAVISRVKILSNLKIDETRLPQDGRFSINYEGRRVDFRVSTMPIANGEKIVMRILDKMTGVIAVEKLGLSSRDYAAVDEAIKKSHGMILVTGPTGSGKTTTLYALLSKIYSEGINIITLEDPIEYQIPGINQSQVNPEIDYTFASGLRSILRQDPDVVMIGEIRDKETAEMAIHAALTGHVVLSTLHTNSASGACPRLIDMGIEPFLLNSSLNLVVGQRLARRICDDCKETETLSDADLSDIKKEIDKLSPEAKKSFSTLTFSKGKGCKSCDNTGYKGRIGLYEVLVVSDKIKELTSNKTSGEDIEKVSAGEGMTTMIQDGILKATQGVTTIEEVWRVTKE